MSSAKWVMVCVALAAGVCCAADKPKSKKPDVYGLMKPANTLIAEAQDSYLNGDAKTAIELFRQAHGKLTDIEVEHFEWATSQEFAQVRFRKALCETEIDRMMLEEAQGLSRLMVVTDTADLEKKRAERKQAAEATPGEVLAPVKLGSKSGGAAGGVATEDIGDEGPVEAGEELEYAKDMIQVDRFEEAERALIRVLRADPENRDAGFLLALSRVQQGRHTDALVALDDVLADHASDEAALLLAAGAYMASGAYSKAIDALDRAMKVNPKRPDALINMAWLLLEIRSNDTTEAELYYRQAVKMGAGRVRDLERRLGIRIE